MLYEIGDDYTNSTMRNQYFTYYAKGEKNQRSNQIDQMKNQTNQFQIFSCISCTRFFYICENHNDHDYCPRCKSFLDRKRPLLYERQTDQVFETRAEASEWLWGIPQHIIKTMIEDGVQVEVYDADTGKTIGFYTLEHWLPEPRNYDRLPGIFVTEEKLNELIESGEILKQ